MRTPKVETLSLSSPPGRAPMFVVPPQSLAIARLALVLAAWACAHACRAAATPGHVLAASPRPSTPSGRPYVLTASFVPPCHVLTVQEDATAENCGHSRRWRGRECAPPRPLVFSFHARLLVNKAEAKGQGYFVI